VEGMFLIVQYEHFTDMNQTKLQLQDNASPFNESSKSKLKLGLFSYPVLQAADILVHRYVCANHPVEMGN
jgi:tryptophanyl-tRNA synthetase